MFDSDNIADVVIKRTLIYIGIIILAMFIGLKNYKIHILSFIFGGGISVLNFKLMDITVKKAVQMPPGKAQSYSTRHYMIRYFIYFIVLLVAGKADYLNFITTMLGLLSIKMVITISAIFEKPSSQDS